jgi:hypothetical protein
MTLDEYHMFSRHDQADGSVVLSGTQDKRTVRIHIPPSTLKGREKSDYADQLRAYFNLPPTPRSRMY